MKILMSLFLFVSVLTTQAIVEVDAEGVTNYVSYRVVNVMEITEANTNSNIAERFAHIKSILNRNKITTRHSYVASPYYKALAYIESDDMDYAIVELVRCEKRLKENKLWVEPADKTVVVEVGE